MNNTIRASILLFLVLFGTQHNAKGFPCSPLGQDDLDFVQIGPHISGEFRAIVVDQDDPNILYAGGATRGILKSVDGGINWTETWGSQQSGVVSSICQSSDGSIYYATNPSNGFQASNQQAEIYKSENRGVSWQKINTPPELKYIDDLEAHPVYPKVIFAASNLGLYLTNDDGLSWRNPVHVNNSTCLFPLDSKADQVLFNSNGSKVFVSIDGRLFVSANPLTDCTYVPVSEFLSNRIQKILLSNSAEDDLIMHAATITTGGAMGDIYISEDAGESWSKLSQQIPRSHPDYNLFDDANLGGGIGLHNFSFYSSPLDPKVFFIGGRQVWKYDQGWTLVQSANSIGSPYGFHCITSMKSAPFTMFYAHSRGLGRSLISGESYQEISDGISSCEIKDISSSKEGLILASGREVSSNLLIPEPNSIGFRNYSVPSRPRIYETGGVSVFSNLLELKFTTNTRLQLFRSQLISNSAFLISDATMGIGGYWTPAMDLWESSNDRTSKDSIVFEVDTSFQSLGIGNGVDKSFSAEIALPQASANIDKLSFQVKAGNMLLRDSNGDGNLTGDGFGTVDYRNNSLNISWNSAPSSSTPIIISFTTNYKAGSVLKLESKTGEIVFEHDLKINLRAGEKVLIQDPIQSVIAFNSSRINQGISISRDALKSNTIPNWIFLEGTGQALKVKFSNDGRHLFYSNSGGIYRVSGIDKLYYPMSPNEVANSITITKIYAQIGVQSFDLHPSKQNEMIICRTSNGTNNNLVVLDNILNTTGNSTGRSLQGNLPDIDVNDLQYNYYNTKNIFIGTHQGVFHCSDYTQSNPEWKPQTKKIGAIPILEVYQQRTLGSSNEGAFYFGTDGRGIWRSSNFVGSEENEAWEYEFSNGLIIYPNPAKDHFIIKFQNDIKKNVSVYVYDIFGRLRFQEEEAKVFNHELHLNNFNLESGNYIINLSDGESRTAAKLTVIQ